MALDIFRPLGATMAFDIGATPIDCPPCFPDLAPDEGLIGGLTGAYRDVGLALGQIEILIASDRPPSLGKSRAVCP